jgi:hypothetical protein
MEKFMRSLCLLQNEPASLRLKANFRAAVHAGFPVLLAAAVVVSQASAQEKTGRDASLPLVYSVENTGAQYPAPTYPSFAQLPIVRPLPDPFLFTNGLRDTAFNAWEVRRNEISNAVQKYEIGPKPDCHDCTITANYAPPPTTAAPGILTVNVTRNGKTLKITSNVSLPQGQGSGPFPALIPMELTSFSFGGTTINLPAPTPDYGSLPASVFQGTPVATVGFPLTQVAGYAFSSPSVHTGDPFYTLYPELCAGVCSGTSNSGEYAAWAWGVSRLIDGMEIATHQSVNPLPIDMTHLGVTGCSYAGKMALIAGAFDERIALTIAQENGGGGAPAWRVSHEIEAQGSVEDIDDTNYDWWAGTLQQFSGANVYKLPEDHHELMAMVAPRALLETGNTDFYWLSNQSNYITARATQKIYNQFQIGDRFGFYIDGGHAHCATLPAEAPAISAFVTKFMLGQSSANSDIEVNPYPSTFNYNRWTWWWSSGENPNVDPQFPNNWVSNGNAVLSLDTGLGVLQANQGQPVSAGYQFKIPGSHPAATATLTGGNVEADFRCPDNSSYTLTIPLPKNQSYSIGANKTAWVPAAGTWQGVAPALACPSGVTTGTLENAYFSALGLANGVGNPPAAPGLTTTDSADPLDVRFACSVNGDSTGYSTSTNVNPQH